MLFVDPAITTYADQIRDPLSETSWVIASYLPISRLQLSATASGSTGLGGLRESLSAIQCFSFVRIIGYREKPQPFYIAISVSPGRICASDQAHFERFLGMVGHVDVKLSLTDPNDLTNDMVADAVRSKLTSESEEGVDQMTFDFE